MRAFLVASCASLVVALLALPAEAERAGGGTPAVGDVLGNAYRLDRMLGAGAAGIVYAATELRSNEPRAIKWMRASAGADSDGAMRLMREYLVSTRIEHESVIDVQRVGRDHGRFFLVMELLDGEPLSARIARGPLGESEAVATIMPALEGVAAAHAQGVVHRDLKPDNIYLLRVAPGESPRAKVLDFGLCKMAADEGEVDLHLTQEVKALGTPLYMSPEQIRDPAAVDRRTDVYSLGVVLYEMLTQRLPFDGKGYNDLIIKVATESPPSPHDLVPGLDARLSDVVMKAMARERDARFADVPALIEALHGASVPAPVPLAQAVATEGTREARQTAGTEAAETPPGVPGWVFDAVAVLGGLGAFVVLLRRGPRRRGREG